MNKVLIVDDEAFMRRLLEGFFTESDPDVNLVFAGSVSEAMDAIEAHDDFAALLTDFNLGDGTGNTVARRFAEKFPKGKIFGMTGNPYHRFDPNVFMHVLEKPFVSQGDKTVLHSICS